jgi:hypothetical protein
MVRAKRIGTLSCDECGREHPILRTKEGTILSTASCPGHSKRVVSAGERNAIRTSLLDANNHLTLASKYFQAGEWIDCLHWLDALTRSIEKAHQLIRKGAK